MNYKKSSDINQTNIDKIINVAYGDGTLKDKLTVKSLIRSNEDAKKIFEHYRKTAAAVGKMGIDNIPEDLLSKMDERVKREFNFKRSIASDLYTIFVSKPAGAFATASLLVLLIVTLFIFNIPVNRQYTDAELIKADRQTKQALLFVSGIFSDAGSTVKDDILTTRVADPLQEGINLVNYLFNEGDKK